MTTMGDMSSVGWGEGLVMLMGSHMVDLLTVHLVAINTSLQVSKFCFGYMILFFDFLVMDY